MKRASPGAREPVLLPPDDPIVARLAAWRRETSIATHVPAYRVLPNATLLEIAERLPTTIQGLLAVRGMGPARVEAYGLELLAIVERAAGDAARRAFVSADGSRGMSERGAREGPTSGRGDWEKREHDAVSRTLDEALADVRFPASKSELVEVAGGANVAETADLPLVKYFQMIPDRRYESADDVKREVNDRWKDARGLRGAGFGASEQGGAPELQGGENR